MLSGGRARPGRGRLRHDPLLAQFIQERLDKRWGPEQISQALRREFPDQPERHVVHETINQAVYRPELGGLRRDLPKVLRTNAHPVQCGAKPFSWLRPVQFHL